MPGPIENVIIAGGISCMEDLEHVWRYPKCIPQLGRAIWKQKIEIGQIYCKIVRFNEDGLVPALIKTTTQKCLGLVYLNEEAIMKTCS